MTRMEFMEEAGKPLGLVIFLSFLLHPYTYTPDTLPGKRILVSDATSMLGEAIAYEYAKVKTLLVLAGSNRTALERVAARCQALGAARVDFLAGDVRDSDYRDSLLRVVRETMGGLDHLMLNHEPEVGAAAAWRGTPEDAAEWRRRAALHFRSYAALTSKALPLLRESEGHVGVVSPLVGKVPVAGRAAFAAATAALHGFFTSLRQELYRRRTDVSVTSVALGYVRSPDGKNVFGRHDPFETEWPFLSVTVSDAAETAIINVVHRKSEVSYPFAAQVCYGFYTYFPNLYHSFVEGFE